MDGFCGLVSPTLLPGMDIDHWDMLNLCIRTDDGPWIASLRPEANNPTDLFLAGVAPALAADGATPAYPRLVRNAAERPFVNSFVRFSDMMAATNGMLKDSSVRVTGTPVKGFGLSIRGPPGPFRIEIGWVGALNSLAAATTAPAPGTTTVSVSVADKARAESVEAAVAGHAQRAAAAAAAEAAAVTTAGVETALPVVAETTTLPNFRRFDQFIRRPRDLAPGPLGEVDRAWNAYAQQRALPAARAAGATAAAAAEQAQAQSRENEESGKTRVPVLGQPWKVFLSGLKSALSASAAPAHPFGPEPSTWTGSVAGAAAARENAMNGVNPLAALFSRSRDNSSDKTDAAAAAAAEATGVVGESVVTLNHNHHRSANDSARVSAVKTAEERAAEAAAAEATAAADRARAAASAPSAFMLDKLFARASGIDVADHSANAHAGATATDSAADANAPAAAAATAAGPAVVVSDSAAAAAYASLSPHAALHAAESAAMSAATAPPLPAAFAGYTPPSLDELLSPTAALAPSSPRPATVTLSPAQFASTATGAGYGVIDLLGRFEASASGSMVLDEEALLEHRRGLRAKYGIDHVVVRVDPRSALEKAAALRQLAMPPTQLGTSNAEDVLTGAAFNEKGERMMGVDETQQAIRKIYEVRLQRMKLTMHISLRTKIFHSNT